MSQLVHDNRNKRVWIKICGITNPADAHAAIEFGADALGFNFYPGSKRFVDLEKSVDWLVELPGEVCKVAILVDPSFEEAIRLADLPFIDALQLHGHESSDFCRGLAGRGVRFAKAVPVITEASLTELPQFFTDSLVLDTATRGQFGGTGQPFPWTWARRFGDLHPNFQVVVGGGLTAENVPRAIHEARPFGVDVTTGVECSPGRKDPRRLREFIHAARQA